MDGFPDEILDHYEREIDEGQRLARGLGQLELLRTREIVRRHLPPAPRRVLDVGGGTGVHAAWLAADATMDLVHLPLERAQDRHNH